MEESKPKAIIIQMLIENQNKLHKVQQTLNRIQHKNLELSHENQTEKLSTHKTDEIKCSKRYETLYTDDNDDKSCNSYKSSASSERSASSDEISEKFN